MAPQHFAIWDAYKTYPIIKPGKERKGEMKIDKLVKTKEKKKGSRGI